MSLASHLSIHRLCRFALFSLAIVAAAMALGVRSISAQQFHDCEGTPGEYLVKYKATAADTPTKRLAAAANTRSILRARVVKEFDSVIPGLELIKTSKTNDQVRSLASSRSLANNIEYIQPNCINKLYENTISGNLRDVAGGDDRYPFALGMIINDKTKDENQLGIFSKQTGLQITTADLYIPDEKGNPSKVAFKPQAYQVVDVSVPRDGFHDIVMAGQISTFNQQTNKEVVRLATYTFPGKGNGTYDSPRPKLYSEIGTSVFIRAIKVGHINDDLFEDIVIVSASIFSSKAHVLLSDGRGSFTETILEFSNFSTDVGLADIDNDGKLDIVAHTADFAWHNTLDGLNGKLEYFLNRGQQGFSPRRSLETGHYLHHGMELKDLNLDGAADLVLLGSRRLLWALNKGDGTFSEFKNIPVMDAFSDSYIFMPRSLHVGDFTGDGLPDAAFLGNIAFKESNDPAEESVLFISNEGGAFTSYRSRVIIDKVDSNFSDHYAYYQDMTGDGRLDIVIRKTEVDSFAVYIGAGLSNGLVSFREDRDYDIAFRGIRSLQAVFDPFGIPGVPVSLRSKTRNFVTFTDKNGNFSFTGVPSDTYTADVSLDSHFFPGFSGSQISVENDIPNLSVTAVRKPWSPPPGPAAPAPNAPNDYAFNSLWGLHNYGQAGGVEDVDVDAPESWSTSTGAGVVVGVFDSGVEVSHSDLSANRYTNSGEIPNNNQDDDKNGYIDDAHGFNPFTRGDPTDEQSHGTHVSGTIAGVGDNTEGVVGVAPKAKVLGIKLSPGNLPSFSLDAIIAGASYVVQAKQRGANIRVVNASYGYLRTCTPADIDYLTALHKADILFVAAAGNDSNDNDKKGSAPANCDVPNIISVAAVDRRGQLADFSNYGAQTVDIAAPGVEIQSLYIGNGYRVEQGTSMAAPHVSGVAALIFAARPDLSVTQVKTLLMETVKPLSSLTGKIAAPGIASAFNALKALGQGGGNGGGNGGGDGGSDGGNGGGSDGGSGGGNGGGSDGGNGGGSDGGSGDGNGGGGNSGQINTTFGLAFSFAQSKSGARLNFEIRSNNPNATQVLNDCKFSVFGGEGLSAPATGFRPLGTVYAGQSAWTHFVERFSTPVLTPKARKKGAKTKKVFLRANASCPAAGVSLVSSPVQVRTSKRKGALSAKRWFTKLASGLR